MKQSILDHVYVKNPILVGEVHSIKPCFGDHMLISLSVKFEKDAIKHTLRRDWRKYTKEVLLEELAMIEWSTDLRNVQNVWDEFESKVVKVVDKIVPLTVHENGKITSETPKFIKNKINMRKRLLKSRKHNASSELKQKINHLNAEIKTFYFTQRKNFVSYFL